RAALDRLPLNRTLATIRTDVELDVAATDLALRQPDVDTLRTFYARYGFGQALKELDGGSANGVVPAKATIARPGPGFVAPMSTPAEPLDPALAEPGRHETILDRGSLEAWIARLREAGGFALDTETDSLDPLRANLVGLSVSCAPGHAA